MSIIDYSAYTPAQLQAAQLLLVAATNPNLDIREGSLIQTALGPESQTVGAAYTNMQAIEAGAFALTATGTQLDLKAAEAGMERNAATPAACVVTITTTTGSFVANSLLPTTGTIEPAWPTLSGASITDNNFIWTEAGMNTILAAGSWSANSSFLAGEIIVPLTVNGHVYVASIPVYPSRFASNNGANSVVFDLVSANTPISGATAPVWPLLTGATVTDGNLTWTCAGIGTSANIWQPNAALLGLTIAVAGYLYTSTIYSYPYSAVCETAGSVGASSGNTTGAAVTLISLAGLSGATLSGPVTGGTDAEIDGAAITATNSVTSGLRARYLAKVASRPFGGNWADYYNLLMGVQPVTLTAAQIALLPAGLLSSANYVQGVGGVQIYPAYAGGGTVELAIIDTTFSSNPALATNLQSLVDPDSIVGITGSTGGLGYGIAPIGAAVSVVTPPPVYIGVAISGMQYINSSYTSANLNAAITAAVQAYLLSVAAQWGVTSTAVPYSYLYTIMAAQIIVKTMAIQGVANVGTVTLTFGNSPTTLGGATTSNLSFLQSAYFPQPLPVPVLAGAVTLSS